MDAGVNGVRSTPVGAEHARTEASMRTRTVRRATSPDAAEDWDRFVSGHPDATPFHSSAWLDTVNETFDYRPESVLLYENGEDDVVAAVPGFRVPGLPGPSVVNPFCEYGYPLLAEGTPTSDVLGALAERTPAFGARILKDTMWSGVGGYSSLGYGAVVTGTSVRVAVDEPYETLHREVFDNEIRRGIRTTRERGFSARRGTVAEFYPLYMRTMRRLGSPQFPRAFFENMADSFGDGFRVLVVRGEEGPIAALVYLVANGMTSLWNSGSNERFWDIKPNHLLYASAVEDACEGDGTIIDFGRSAEDSSVAEFKRHFGGLARPLVSYVTPPHRTSRAAIEQYAAAQPVTRRLAPLITHRGVGPRLKEVIHE